VEYVQLEKGTAQRMGRATVRVEKMFPQLLPERKGPRGGSGPGGSLTRVRVYDNLTGATVDDDGEIIVPTVRGLYETRTEAGGWNVDTEAEYVTLEPAPGVVIDLGDAGCCGGGEEASGLVIVQPIMGGNIITDATATEVVVKVTGVARTNSVTVTISGAGGSDQVVSGVYPAADGVATLGLFDVTGFNKGVLKVKAQAFEPGPVALPARYAALPYAKADDTADLALHDNGMPLAPTLQAASDTGTSAVDGYTDDDTPTFDTYPNTPLEASGPAAFLYANGDLVYEGDEDDFDTLPFPVNVATPLADGIYDFQLVTVYIDTFGPTENFYGPASLPTRVVIVADASAGAGSDDATCYMRRGLASTVDGILTLVRFDSCPSPMSAAEQAKWEAS
jgi:hypothetical protein